MAKLLILYYSRTGNTELMARAVFEGAKEVQEIDSTLKIDFEATPEELGEADAFIVGMPTYHRDMTRSIKTLFEDTASKGVSLKEKIGATFGSYGWSGEAPNMILEIMVKRFEMNVIHPPLRIKNKPNEKGLEECRNFGKKVAEKIRTRTLK
ncbi:MAG: FprA family A-type flavoprotein [Candidatus Bathyarchaeota archaeon]|nr:MAG: FprA family A-type flavoprotein [Candidatus Bathyarchaeota archaeon]